MLVKAHQSALRAAGVRIETLACVGTEHPIDEEGSATVQADDNETPVPSAIADALGAAYQRLCIDAPQMDLPVAVHSSATKEDLATKSFAGPCATYLGICGDERVVNTVRPS